MACTVYENRANLEQRCYVNDVCYVRTTEHATCGEDFGWVYPGPKDQLWTYGRAHRATRATGGEPHTPNSL